MKSSKGKGLIGLLMIIAVVAVFGWFGYSSMGDIKLGLDLAGGVSITYQAVEENPTAEQMSDTIYKLQQRVEHYSMESEVYQEGSNRIIIGCQCYPSGIGKARLPGVYRRTVQCADDRGHGGFGEGRDAGRKRRPGSGVCGSAYPYG